MPRNAPTPVAPSPDAGSFHATFERLVAKVGAATPPDEMRALHRAFEQRTGAFGPDDPWFESRSRAFWDDALTRHARSLRVEELGDVLFVVLG